MSKIGDRRAAARVRRGGRPVIAGVSEVVIDVDDQARALEFWTEKLGFALHQDTPCGEERRVEVKTPGSELVLVLTPRRGNRPSAPDMLPTSNVFFSCDDLTQMGFGVAVALLIDATIVRCVLVPATMRLLGERNWYLPVRLSWLPDVHVGGSEPPRAGQPGAWSTHAAREGL